MEISIWTKYGLNSHYTHISSKMFTCSPTLPNQLRPKTTYIYLALLVSMDYEISSLNGHFLS